MILYLDRYEIVKIILLREYNVTWQKKHLKILKNILVSSIVSLFFVDRIRPVHVAV